MTLATATLESRYAALGRASGTFSMLALDQRVSLENLYRAAGLDPVQEDLDAFRSAAVEALTPGASAVLLERGYLSRAGGAIPRDDRCALIVAADALVQADNEVVTDSDLDSAGADVAVAVGATALKLLVVWWDGESNDHRIALARTFRELAHHHDLVAIVEAIVRARDGRTPPARALIEAASALSPESDLYKAQVPIHDGWEPADVERLSREVSTASVTPWVVLSAGVPADPFPSLLSAACRGGASGFLAGRGIWGTALGARSAADPRLQAAARDLAELGSIVDRDARPWREVRTHGG